MSIHQNHPSILDFKKNEVDTLEYLTTRKLLKDYTDLHTSIEHCFYNFKERGKLKNKDFVFEINFEMKIERKPHTVIIGANISGDFEISSYCLAICGKDNPLNLIRKFHFDYANPNVKTRQPVPIFHLQFGGKATPKMNELNVSTKDIETWISVPRLNYAPINLALLLDMLFCEFRTEETNRIVENSDWRTLIKRNEELLIIPYYTRIADFSTSQLYSSQYLIRDFCYGKEHFPMKLVK